MFWTSLFNIYYVKWLKSNFKIYWNNLWNLLHTPNIKPYEKKITIPFVAFIHNSPKDQINYVFHYETITPQPYLSRYIPTCEMYIHIYCFILVETVHHFTCIRLCMQSVHFRCNIVNLSSHSMNFKIYKAVHIRRYIVYILKRGFSNSNMDSGRNSFSLFGIYVPSKRT